VALAASSAYGTTLYSDNFNIDTSASWNINASSADNSAVFAFDYSAIGVPASPNGGGSTLGLRLASNIASPADVQGITLSPVGQSFSTQYQLTFDMWINANGPFPGGGAGSTEYVTAGIGYDDTTVNLGGASGSGGWFAVDGEGGSARDYRGYKNTGEQFAESGQFFAGLSSAGGGAHNNSDPYYAAFGGIDVAATVPNQTLAHPQQTGVTAVGAAGFAWHEVAITVVGTTATWEINGLPIARLDTTIGSPFPLNGNISVGFMDIFTSVSSDAAVSFGLIDNLVVTDVPEPASLALLALGGLALLRRR
jgi:hypothetical protein